MKQYKSSVLQQNDDVQDFDVQWDQALLSASEIPTEMTMKGVFKSKLQDSVGLQCRDSEPNTSILSMFTTNNYQSTPHSTTRAGLDGSVTPVGPGAEQGCSPQPVSSQLAAASSAQSVQTFLM